MTMIKLTEILQLPDLTDIKIRFIKQYKDCMSPLDLFKNKYEGMLLHHLYYNGDKKAYREGETTIGFARIQDDLWLLFHVGRVTEDLNILNTADGYKHDVLHEHDKFLGRLIIKYKNKSQNMIRRAESVINEIEVHQILPDIFDNDIFPGYENVNLSWNELSRIIDKDNWKTALQNQKGVYLITDTSNGKRYVGSAYSKDGMILGRWHSYVKNGHGDNVNLKKLKFDYIKENFRYSILDIYKSTVKDEVITRRESWWKEVLMSRNWNYGYNLN